MFNLFQVALINLINSILTKFSEELKYFKQVPHNSARINYSFFTEGTIYYLKHYSQIPGL